ncbi:dynamin central region protein [Ceratobasidium sp. AG-Ba]|nr:dynamin central region protein [Ceratobasidium sp. AG-Ba]QRW10370.1 dynamin central region protein [Ceratobasidium sp. AG-Ba]
MTDFYCCRARTREWPGHFPFQVVLDFTEKIVNKWNDPMKRCFENVVKSFETKLLELVHIHFGAYSHGGLLDQVRGTALDLAEDCRSNTSLLLDKCIDQELHPETTHEELYIHHEAQFTNYYRQFFESTNGLGLLALVLEVGASPEVAAAIRLLESHGLSGMSPSEWRSVQPTKRQDRDALKIMASVRAHYQVAFKRFSDKVKDTVNQSYSYDFRKRIENLLRRGLQLNSADAPEEYFAHLTMESEDVEALRVALKDKAKRLHDARMKLS